MSFPRQAQGPTDLQRQLKPVIDVLVLDEEAVAKLLWGDSLLESPGFRRRAILVGAAYVERRVSTLSTVAREAVGGEGRPEHAEPQSQPRARARFVGEFSGRTVLRTR